MENFHPAGPGLEQQPQQHCATLGRAAQLQLCVCVCVQINLILRSAASSSSSECCTGLLEAPFFFIFVPLEFFIPYNMSNIITIIMNMVIVIVRTRWFVHCPLAELCIVPHDLSTNLIVPRNFVDATDRADKLSSSIDQ